MSPRPGAPSVPPSGALPCPPVRGAPRVPSSRPDPGPPTGRTSKVKNVFRFKLDAKSIPEALATTFRILLKFSIVLAHRQTPGASAHPAPSDTPHPPPIRTPSAPHPSPGRSCDLFLGIWGGGPKFNENGPRLFMGGDLKAPNPPATFYGGGLPASFPAPIRATFCCDF